MTTGSGDKHETLDVSRLVDGQPCYRCGKAVTARLSHYCIQPKPAPSLPSAIALPDHDGHGNPIGTEYVLRVPGSTKDHDYVTVESYLCLKAELERANENRRLQEEALRTSELRHRAEIDEIRKSYEEPSDVEEIIKAKKEAQPDIERIVCGLQPNVAEPSAARDKVDIAREYAPRLGDNHPLVVCAYRLADALDAQSSGALTEATHAAPVDLDHVPADYAEAIEMLRRVKRDMRPSTEERVSVEPWVVQDLPGILEEASQALAGETTLRSPIIDELLGFASALRHSTPRPTIERSGPPDAGAFDGNAHGLTALLEENKRLKEVVERQMNDAEAARLELAEERAKRSTIVPSAAELADSLLRQLESWPVAAKKRAALKRTADQIRAYLSAPVSTTIERSGWTSVKERLPEHGQDCEWRDEYDREWTWVYEGRVHHDCIEWRPRSAPSTLAPSDEEIKAALFAYEGALSEDDSDEETIEPTRNALLDVLRRLREAALSAMENKTK